MNAFLRGAPAVIALAWSAAALAQVVAVPDAHLHHAEGSVAHAPRDDQEWHDVQPRRVLKRGDRLWTDRGSRAELQAGGHALRVDSQTQVTLENASRTSTQLSLTQGSLLATVTRANPGDSFEIGTPNLAFRARQPGDYRIDVDASQGTTRVVVLAGTAVVYGEQGQAQELKAGQRATFRERGLAKVKLPLFAATDDFDRWAGARRRGEPTVRMPTVAAAPAAAPSAAYNGRTIIIAGPASAQANARPTAPGAAAPAPPLPALPALPAPRMQVVTAGQGPAMLMKVTTPAGAPAAASAPAVATQPPPEQQERQRLAQRRAEEQRQSARRAEDERRLAAQGGDEERKAAAQPGDEERKAAAAQSAQQERRAGAAQRAEQVRRAAAAKAQEDRRQLQARRAEDQRRAVPAKRAEPARRLDDDRRQQAQARRQQEQRQAQALRADADKRQAQARRAADDKRLIVLRREEDKRRADAVKQAELRKFEERELADGRRRELARLQAQAAREEQATRQAQGWRELQARRGEEERREEQARRQEQARRDEEAQDRRHRVLVDQSRRDQQRREQEVWLRQQQFNQPVRPAPMGVPARRVS